MGKNKLDKQGRPKKPFYQTWLPWKGDRPSQVILKLLTLVMLVVFLGAAGYLVNELVILPMQADQVVSEIQDVFYETEEPSSSESSESADPSASPEATQEPEEEQPEMTDEEFWNKAEELLGPTIDTGEIGGAHVADFELTGNQIGH